MLMHKFSLAVLSSEVRVLQLEGNVYTCKRGNSFRNIFASLVRWGLLWSKFFHCKADHISKGFFLYRKAKRMSWKLSHFVEMAENLPSVPISWSKHIALVKERDSLIFIKTWFAFGYSNAFCILTVERGMAMCSREKSVIDLILSHKMRAFPLRKKKGIRVMSSCFFEFSQSKKNNSNLKQWGKTNSLTSVRPPP